MFNRHAIGVRAHADGDGVKQAIVPTMTLRGLIHLDTHPRIGL